MISGFQSSLNPRVVCIPVTTDEIDCLPLTLPSVLGKTSTETEILLLGMDVAPALLPSTFFESPRIKMAPTRESDDPWRALLRALPSEYAEHDVLLLRPGMEVPRDWDTRLALSVYRKPGIAAAIPLCDSIPLLALFDLHEVDRIDLDRIDRLLLAHSPRRDPEMPVLFGGCAYLRQAAVRVLSLGPASRSTATDGEWFQWLAPALREQGWSIVCCDHVYVLDHIPENRGRERAVVADLEDARLIERTHPLTGLRLAMRALLAQDLAFIPTARSPVQLHIVHSWGGGLDYWVKQYCEGDRTRTNLVLRSIGTWGAFGQRIALYRSAVMGEPLRYWTLDYPIRATALAHLQYRAILREVIADFAVEAILVSSLIGHALDALDTGLPTVMIAHDYYPFCPAIVIHFGEVCDRCEYERLERCFVENEQNRFFRNINATEWLSLRRRFARLAAIKSVRFAVPSPTVARHWRILVPELRDQSFTVIPHGLDYTPGRLPAPIAGDRLRVVVLGSLAVHKGRGLLEQVWPLLAGRVDLYLIGCEGGGEVVQSQPGMTIIPHYRHDELADLLRGIQPEVGLLLSVWPETFSYTLSELWLIGIPVVATDLGSFADRIQEGVNGFLCPPQAQAVADRLLVIAADRACLTPIHEWLTSFRHRSVAEMVADYHALVPLPEFSAVRYFTVSATLPKESAANDLPRALHIDARFPFSEALREFGQYARLKLAATPRLSAWQKRALAVLLAWSLRGVAMLVGPRNQG